MANFSEQFIEIQGKEYSFRSARKEDAQMLVAYLRQTAAETPYLLREPEEVTISAEREQIFIMEKEADDRELMLLCFDGERHVGNCSIMAAGGMMRQAHRCGVAIALETARQMGYEQAELDVVSANEAAIRLYEKLGFRQYGVFPHNMKYRDGSYADCVWMMKEL